MSETVPGVVKNHADTKANLIAADLTPLAGEITIESDSLETKIGDGVTSYANLVYNSSPQVKIVHNITTASDETVDLPDALTTNREFVVKRRGSGTGVVLFTTVSSQTIDGLAPSNYSLHGDGDYIVFFPSAGNWEIKDRSGLGIAQTWQDVIGSRVVNVTYTNDTGKPIEVYICANNTSGSQEIGLTIDGSILLRSSSTGGANLLVTIVAIIPNGSTYILNPVAGAIGSIATWAELR